MKEFYLEFAKVADQVLALENKSEEVTKMKEATIFYLDMIEKMEDTNTINDESKSILSEFLDIAKDLLEQEAS